MKKKRGPPLQGRDRLPDRLAGRLCARLHYADMDELEAQGASAFLTTSPLTSVKRNWRPWYLNVSLV